MVSSPSNSLTESATVEQVITEFFSKSLHIILESHSPYVSSRNYSGGPCVSSPSSSSSSSSSSSGRLRDKWFNLALRYYPAALENCDVWRQSTLERLVVHVVLVRRPSHRTLLLPVLAWVDILLTRRHSWSNECGAVPSVSPSPSPTYSDTNALQCNPYPCTSPPGHVFNQFPSKCSISNDASLSPKKNTGCEEYWPSPPFSPSTSPSPPTYIHSGQSANALLRSESAPVSVASPRFGRKQGLPPPPHIRAMKPGISSQTDVLRIRTTIPPHTSPESRLQTVAEPGAKITRGSNI